VDWLQVNGVDVSTALHDEAVSLLTRITGEVILSVSRGNDSPSKPQSSLPPHSDVRQEHRTLSQFQFPLQQPVTSLNRLEPVIAGSSCDSDTDKTDCADIVSEDFIAESVDSLSTDKTHNKGRVTSTCGEVVNSSETSNGHGDQLKLTDSAMIASSDDATLLEMRSTTENISYPYDILHNKSTVETVETVCAGRSPTVVNVDTSVLIPSSISDSNTCQIIDAKTCEVTDSNTSGESRDEKFLNLLDLQMIKEPKTHTGETMVNKDIAHVLYKDDVSVIDTCTDHKYNLIDDYSTDNQSCHPIKGVLAINEQLTPQLSTEAAAALASARRKPNALFSRTSEEFQRMYHQYSASHDDFWLDETATELGAQFGGEAQGTSDNWDISEKRELGIDVPDVRAATNVVDIDWSEQHTIVRRLIADEIIQSLKLL